MASEEWSWPVVIAIIAAPLTLIWFFFGSKGKKGNFPPGPPSWPVIGHLPVLMDSSRPKHQVFNELAKIYGPVVSLKVGLLNLVIVSGLETVMEVLKEKDHLFAYRPDGLLVIKYVGYGNNNISMGQQGEARTFLRKLVVSELLASKKLQGFQAVRGAELDTLIRQCFQASLNKEGVNVHKQLSSMAVRIISQLSFGKNSDSKTLEEWVDVLPAMTECFALPLLESFHPALKWLDTLTGNRKKMQQAQKKIDRILQAVLDYHTKELDALSLKELKDYEPKDIMDIILLQRNGENSRFITDTAVKAVGVDLIGAGSDSVTATMEWVMVELLINPHMMKRAQQELDSVVGKERFVTEDDVEKLPYLAAILKETFRLHNIVPMLIPHSNRVDCKIGGYDIPANSFVNLNVYGLSRNPSIWNDPLRWNPDRFLSGSMAAVDAKGGYPQLLPFGRGRRMCPGMGFAHSVMYTVLARLIHSFDWSLPEGQTASKMDMSERSGLIAAKAKALIAVPKPRLAPQVYKAL